MEMKINRLILFCFLSVLFLIRCKEDEPAKDIVCSDSNTVKYPSNALSKLYFKDSSYWIYQDSLTKYLDSVWVIKSERNSEHSFRGVYLNNRCYHKYYYELISSRGDRTIVQLVPIGVYEELDYSNETFKANYSIKSAGYHINQRFSLRGNEFLNLGSAYGDTLVFSDSMKVINKNYNNILKMQVITQYIDIYKEAYYVDSVGLIKYKLLDNSVWELLRYNVKQ